MKKSPVKVTLTMNEDLLKKVEEYADTLSINRSNAVCVLVSQALEQREALNVMNQVPVMLAKMEAMKLIKAGQDVENGDVSLLT